MVKKVGNNNANTLNGTAFADQLYGRGGDDVLNGRGGNDKLYGGIGDDTMRGGAGKDKAYGGAGDDDAFGGAGNDELQGGGGNDELYGGAGNDKVVGGQGDDLMDGGAGDDNLHAGPNSGAFPGGDTMIGGLGSDTFHFVGDVGRTTINDFTDNVDTLVLSRAYFQNIADLSGGAVTTATMTVQDVLTYYASSSGGDSAIDLSGNGADAPRIILNGVDNAFNLADDIILV